MGEVVVDIALENFLDRILMLADNQRTPGEHQANTRRTPGRTPGEHQANTRANTRRTPGEHQGEHIGSPLHLNPGRTHRFAPTLTSNNRMKYDHNIHHRRSIRLKGYDYSQAGLYFVTICTQHHECFFGNIASGEMFLNDAGKMVGKWYSELENKFPDIKCLESIIMPNHFHCIVQNVGADLRVCPDWQEGEHIGSPLHNVNVEHMGEQTGEHIDSPLHNVNVEHMGEQTGEHIGSPLHRVVQWFKTMSTNEYIRGVKNHGWKRFNGKLWQRNYYEHIIRDEESYHQISDYIINNPLKWDTDEYHIS